MEVSCLRTIRGDSNSGAMSRKLAGLRAGAQPEQSGDEARGAGESLSRHQKGNCKMELVEVREKENFLSYNFEL